ncbi:hypothetical protein Tco_0527490 [Tanacetum coccineum]
MDLETNVTREEIKRAVWDYGVDKSPDLMKSGFGDKRRGWIQSCLNSSRGSVMVNGSPTKEFQFHGDLKQGDPLSPFLFILIMERLYISVERVVDAGMFKGLRINMNKSKLMGISVANIKVDQVAAKIRRETLKAPFSYLGSKVGDLMSHIQPWNDILNKLTSRLSKWKMKTLSIRGRLTLLKSVLGSMPIYNMSLFKVPMKVLQRMEAIKCHFFNGVDHNSRKPIWVKWSKVLALRKSGYGLIRAQVTFLFEAESMTLGCGKSRPRLDGVKLYQSKLIYTPEKLVSIACLPELKEFVILCGGLFGISATRSSVRLFLLRHLSLKISCLVPFIRLDIDVKFLLGE